MNRRTSDWQPDGAEPEGSPEQTTPPRLSRRKFLLGSAAVIIGGIAYDTTVGPDIIGTQADRRRNRERHANQEAWIREGESLYAEAFFASNPTLIKPGDNNIRIVNNPALADLLNSETHTPQSEDWSKGFYRYIGIAWRQLGKEAPTWFKSPPHINIKEYDNRPSFMEIVPDDSNLVGLPKTPKTPAGVLAIFDGAEEFAGDITISMGEDIIDVANQGLGQHRVHLFALQPE